MDAVLFCGVKIAIVDRPKLPQRPRERVAHPARQAALVLFYIKLGAISDAFPVGQRALLFGIEDQVGPISVVDLVDQVVFQDGSGGQPR